jgi:NADH:ubiquinone reductase (H+-translocating)
MNIPKINKKRVVILGGGFGGLKLAEKISTKNYQIVLIDRNNYHQFQPLFYQVATAGLEPSSIVFPYRKIFHNKKDFYFRLGEVLRIEEKENLLHTSIGKIEFDYLIIATGADTNFYGSQNIEKYAFPMKSIQEALQLRNTIFQRFEDAINTSDLDKRAKLLTLVVVGGGPTGVEVAGTLAEMKLHILPKDYPDMDFSLMKIILLEGSSRVLNAMDEVSCNKAKLYLEELGVEVRINVRVLDYDGEQVFIKDELSIPSKTVIWSAGIKGNLLDGLSDSVHDQGNRIKVNEFNQVESIHNNIYAIGDVATMVLEDYPRGHPQMAQPAIQQGLNLAMNLNRLKDGQALTPFNYKNLGSMATIGRNKAVVELPKYKFQGFFAWVVWLVVHLKSILGVKNKFVVLLNWIWNYLTYNLSLRLIIKPKGDKF